MARPRKSTPLDAIQAFWRLPRRQQLITLGIFLAIASVAGVVYYAASRKPTPMPSVGMSPPSTRPAALPAAPSSSQPTVDHLLLGNPSNARPDPNDKDNFLMVKPYFALSYNNSTGCPNWVSWRVAAEDLGDAPRKRTFDTDLTLPTGFKRVEHRDYTSSGFDRGHMCPHGDRDATIESSYATFVMTNIIPQAPKVNQGNWADLEDYCRHLVMQGNHLYVIAGPVGSGGTGSNGTATSIGNGRVTVPAECWKVVVVVPATGGDEDLAKIGRNTRVIALIILNDQAVGSKSWKQFVTDADAVEQRTSYHFFNRLPPDIAKALKAKVDSLKR